MPNTQGLPRGGESDGLRQFLRRERLTAAMLLAETQHHAAPRGQHGQEQGGREGRDGQRHGPEDSASQGGQHGVLFSGRRWGCAGRPADTLRHTAEQIIETFVPVQVLDTPVPQLGDQVVELLQKIDAPAFDELVIAVPKISLDRTPQRSACRRPRRVEQMVEVHTIVSYSSLQQRIAEQTIDIPVPHDRGGRGGGGSLQGFSQGQGSTAFSGAEFVDIPVPRRGGLHGPASTASS